jgi:hypothetical protein
MSEQMVDTTTSVLLMFDYSNFTGCNVTRVTLGVRIDIFTAVTMMNAILRNKPSSYLTRDTLCLRYIVQPVNAM